MNTTLATIPCAHDGCDQAAVWHFFDLLTGNLVGSSCGTEAHYDEFDEDFRAVHTKDAFEIVNRMNRACG